MVVVLSQETTWVLCYSIPCGSCVSLANINLPSLLIIDLLDVITVPVMLFGKWFTLKMSGVWVSCVVAPPRVFTHFKYFFSCYYVMSVLISEVGLHKRWIFSCVAGNMLTCCPMLRVTTVSSSYQWLPWLLSIAFLAASRCLRFSWMLLWTKWEFDC
jgi:hypothetical protein